MFSYARIKQQYFIYGAGLLLAFVQCAIKRNVSIPGPLSLPSETWLPFLIAAFAVAIYIFLFTLFKIEQQWDLKISKQQKFWKMRPDTDSGIWLATLFPISLLVSSLAHLQTCTPLYIVTTTLTLGYMISSLAFLCKGIEEDMPLLKACFFLQLPISTILSLFLHSAVSFSVWYGFPICVFSQTLFLIVVMKLILNCPLSFTIGELLIVAQLVTALISSSLLWLFKRIFHLLCNLEECDYGPETTQFLQVLTLGSGVIAATLLLQPYFKRTAPFYGLCAVTGAVIVYPAWFFILNSEPLTWLLQFCFNGFQRRLLIGHWISCVLMAVAIVAWRNFHQLQTTTAVRKYFHAIIVLIYLPGLVWDRELLFLASGVALFLFFVVEMIRVLEMPPFGKILDTALRIFLDEKDSGNLILTHIYLFVGCSFPLWILPSKLAFCLAILSGTLALGFGDTAASLCGTMFGRHKIQDSKKSVEGTLCSLVVQLVVTVAFCLYGNFFSHTLDMLHVCLATSFCCALEAFTNQIDNLVLPIFLYLMVVVL